MTIDKAIILSAGKGSRLLPLTEDTPKCLLDCSGKTLLEWQLDALFAGGFTEAVIVTGFREDKVERVAEAQRAAGRAVTTLFNPFYHVADNLGSIWMARGAFDRDCAVLNGDTLISPDIVRLLREGAAADAITLSVNEKDDFDADDMKVLREGSRLLRVGKTIEAYDAESIGFMAFAGAGRAAFLAEVEAWMRRPEGVTSWYLKAIDRIAAGGIVGTVAIGEAAWQEVDFPPDLVAAKALTAKWAVAGGF
ncbi:sugar phosphate nucleotidyltransferase [Sphingomonas jatrophae]|nr:sugar phosphate nucleotidyltransferase [Sphingomonas jatrophae]